MATGEFQMPEVRSFLLSDNFDNLFDKYGNGIYNLNTGNNNPTAPTDAAYWMLLQFKMWASGAWYGGQLAINTTVLSTYYMRKHRGNNGWTEWKSLTFS